MAMLRTNDIAIRLRLASGLVLFAFLFTHLVNHALALVSIDAMVAMQDGRQAVTRSLAGTAVLVTAFILHAVLGLSRLATRATLNLPRWQQVQIFSGLALPLLLLPHVIETRIAHELFGVDDSYLYVLARYWPAGALMQLSLVVVAWGHAAVGIHHWLRHTRFYGAVYPVLAVIAVAVPLLALAGFMVAGRAVSGMMSDATTAAAVKAAVAWPTGKTLDTLESATLAALLAVAGLLGFVAIIAAIRHVLRLGAVKFPLSYLGGPTLRVARGPTLLEFSQMHRIPHAAVCGGRGRCGTCRVRVDDGLAGLPVPRGRERRVLQALGAPADVRLACRIRPTEAIAVSRLVNPARMTDSAAAASGGEAVGQEDSADAAGVEKPLVILAVDIVDFRGLNQRRLACDKLHLLNAFIAMVDAEAQARGGYVERSVGDGVIAVFGHRDGLDAGCRLALETAAAIDRALDGLNANLAAEIGRDIELGMAACHGRVLMGRIATSSPGVLSVVGEPVAIAGRLESLNRDVKSQLIVPREFANRAGVDVTHAISARVEVRGVSGPLDIVAFPRARDIGWIDNDERPTLALGKPLGRATSSLVAVACAVTLPFDAGRAAASEPAADLMRQAAAQARREKADALLRDAGIASAPLKSVRREGMNGDPERDRQAAPKDGDPIAGLGPGLPVRPAPAPPSDRVKSMQSAAARVDIEIPLETYDPEQGFDDKTKSLLTIIARALADPSAAGSRFRIVGHAEADDAAPGQGTAATEEERSRAYAEAVAAFLRATPGVSSSRLEIEARGAEQPKWPSRPGDAANRRVVILSLAPTAQPPRPSGASAD